MLDHAEELFKQADVNGDGVLSCSEASEPHLPAAGLRTVCFLTVLKQADVSGDCVLPAPR